MSGLRLYTKLAKLAFIEAMRRGLPCRFKVLGEGSILVEYDDRRWVYYVRALSSFGEESAIVLDLYPTPLDAFVVKLVEINDTGVRILPENVPHAIALNPDVMSRYEADVWSRRIRFYASLKPSTQAPPKVRELFKGMIVAFSEELGEYAILDVSGTVTAWCNPVFHECYKADGGVLRF